MYFGGTIETFALPLGTFIVISIILFYLFRWRHSGPKLKYLAPESFNSIGTREPGPVPAPPVTAAAPEPAAPETAAAEPAGDKESTETTGSAESTTEPEK